MNVVTVIFSYNTPARTHHCYNELLRNNPAWNQLVVLDNSVPDKVCQTPDTIWLGEKNLGHGGMIDYVLERWRPAIEEGSIDYIGMLNNDTHGYDPHFMTKLLPYLRQGLALNHKIISPSFVSGSCWPTMLRHAGQAARETNFVETISPWYHAKLLKQMLSLMPMEYFGHIDRALSILACVGGGKNLLVDELAITHDAGIGRDELGTRADYVARWRTTVKAWYDAHPEIAGLDEVWPEEINARKW